MFPAAIGDSYWYSMSSTILGILSLLIFANLVGMKRYLSVCIFLMISKSEHLLYVSSRIS